MRTRLALLLGTLVLLTGGAAHASTTPADVAAVLRDQLLYVADDAETTVDEGRLRDALQATSVPVYVAVLPDRAVERTGGAGQLNSAIGQAVGGRAALITVAEGGATGGSQGVGLGTGQADAIVQQSVRGATDLTDGLVTAVQRIDEAARSGGLTGQEEGTSSGGGGGGGLVLGTLALLGLGAGGLYLRGQGKRRRAQMDGYRADVTSLYDRLGSDVSTLAPGDDPVARQAMADAAERYNATGALLATADEQGEYAAARRTVAEGLAATRLARQRLGLDPGPEVPPPPSEQPQLIRQQPVQVGEQEYVGSPYYAPGRQHYWQGGAVGGRYVPGGWYGVDFGSLVMGGLIGGMLSGGLGGGGYGAGYGAGYEEGVEDITRGGGGFGGGGDWGGSGDWGGGGGDFGGGGGDSW